MGRPREFDIEAALDKAMQVFWSKGYEATSLDDLCEATGLGRSSMYAAFTDKRRIYLQVLQRYEQRAVARVTKALAGDGPVRDDLASFLREVIDSIAHGTGRRGCLIGNSAAGLNTQDKEVAEVVRHSLDQHELAFRGALERAQQRGEIAPGEDVRALARFITASFHGLRIFGKVPRDKAALEDVAGIMLRCLDRPSK
jgi:TetR/AcrR family transcriptional repressor of nem operon